MADITSGTGADSMEDIRDEPALESVGVDPDAPIAQADATEPGRDEEDDDEFDEDEADEEDDADDEDEQQASDTETE
jgi:hypothetical protein